MFQKFFLALVAFLCAFAIPSVGTSAADSDIIENNEAGIPNKALYESILKELMKDPVGTFTEGEAKSISFLYHNASDGGSLKGIGHLSALEDLELEYYKPVNVKQSLEGIDELTGLVVAVSTGPLLRRLAGQLNQLSVHSAPPFSSPV